VASIGAMAAFGLPGAGVGYLVSQTIYFVAVWVIVRRQVPTHPGRLQFVLLLVALGCGGLLLLRPSETIRLVVFGLSAIGLAAVGWPRMYRMHVKGEL
jgi:hypothetical protein